MSNITRLINDIYQGIYYNAIKYETVETAKSSLRLRMIVIFYLYYVGVVILFIALRVRTYGPYKPNPLGVLIAMFGIYFVIYKYFIHARILEFSFDHPVEERKKKVKVCLQVFIGGIATFFLCFAIVYFAYKK